ncbi:GGDEF domain-containing protein [Thauera humireducens]|uniref:GGDEF domain-containing protein n=1 Tax=Thauera humireducens TaxID=1134435 RepID=UPI00311FD08B
MARHRERCAPERHGDRLAVLFLDLDNFKTVNDSLGHPVGDRLLAAVARRLSGCLREDRLARLGGDEFVALLPRLEHPGDAATVARKMLEVLDDTLRIEDHDLRPSVSIGIALYPDDGQSVDVLLKHADTAMYGAKAAGRNNFQFFVPAMNERVPTSASSSKARCAGPLPESSCCCTTNPRSTPAAAAQSAARRWCAGNTPNADWCRRPSSSRSPRMWE